ncbi:MAG: adenosylcobinamide-GDP ribazoletransferase [Lachnotalea sp.]
MLWNSFKIAFSMYSKIPMPKTDWNKKNMRYTMCFFPLIGIVIGAAIYFWSFLCGNLEFGLTLRIAGYIVIPILITGGIHLDGFIDTQDALSSYKSKEEKLEILKDSHIGAFALISCIIYFVIAAGVWSELSQASILPLAAGFVLSRALSGLAIVTFSCAKDSGLAHMFSDASQKNVVRITMIILIILASGVMIVLGGIIGLSALLGAVILFQIYRYAAYKEFGGITGDLAGWFLQLCELAMAIGALVGQIYIFQ